MIPEIFDSHFHIIDSRFPLVANNAYLPPGFTYKDYVERMQNLNVVGGALVSASFQGFDQTYLIDALDKLGPSFVGVTQLPASVTDEEIIRLNKIGVRAVRFNLYRGGSEEVSKMEQFAKRIFDLSGWHIELYVDSVDLPQLSSLLLKLPAVSIAHLGLSKDGFNNLLTLVEKGIKVKATGFGRVDFNVKEALKDLVSVNPDGVLFGTDLPSTRAKRPFRDDDVRLILETFETSLSEKILCTNAKAFYRPEKS